MPLCLHGAHHRLATRVDDVHYVQIRSASYLWVCEVRADGRLHRFAVRVLTLDPKGTIRLTGRKSTFANRPRPSGSFRRRMRWLQYQRPDARVQAAPRGEASGYLESPRPEGELSF